MILSENIFQLWKKVCFSAPKTNSDLHTELRKHAGKWFPLSFPKLFTPGIQLGNASAGSWDVLWHILILQLPKMQCATGDNWGQYSFHVLIGIIEAFCHSWKSLHQLSENTWSPVTHQPLKSQPGSSFPTQYFLLCFKEGTFLKCRVLEQPPAGSTFSC